MLCFRRWPWPLICLRRWLRVLWVCRASVGGVLLGLILATRPQVHDLFLDVGAADPQAAALPGFGEPVGGAIVLALIVTFLWALPVHAVARLAVSSPGWLKSPYVFWNPRAHGDSAVLFLRPGQYAPRALGLACYAIALGAAAVAWWDLPIANDEPLAKQVKTVIYADAAALLVAALLFCLYARLRRHVVNGALGLAAGLGLWRALGRLPFGPTPARAGRIARARMPKRPRVGISGDDDKIALLIDWAFAAFATLFLLAALLWPGALDDRFFRLRLLPLLLGLWVPVFGLLALLGYRYRAPFGFFALLALVAGFYSLGDNHESQLARSAPIERLTLHRAVQSWEAANCPGGAARNCPSPIVALVSGGASRSGFFAASVFGLMTDVTCEKDETLCASPLFARRLFAISSVSGGSVGAAVYAKALADHKPDFGPPCDSGLTSPTYFRKDVATWRGCLQEILAGDFLSPVIAGLGFRDVIGFVGKVLPDCWWPDRGQRIEAALAYGYLYYKDRDAKHRCAAARMRGLDDGFATLAPEAADDPAKPKPWRPALLLNSTDSHTGKRFVFSAIAAEAEGAPRWLEDAYDFYEAFPNCEIRIAAAAHDSARFPLVSPAGALYPDCKPAPPRWLDKLKAIFVREAPRANLVDGGYFDNYGASTARDLVAGLRKEGLSPFVLVITNDPRSVERTQSALENATGRPAGLTDVPGSWPIPPLVAAPLDAVIAAASGRGELALEELRSLVDPRVQRSPGDNPGCLNADPANDKPCLALVAVYPPGEKGTAKSIANRLDGVSMSWWLSKPVQQYLDNQLELPPPGASPSDKQRNMAKTAFTNNHKSLNRVCDVLAGPEKFADACKARLDRLSNGPL